MSALSSNSQVEMQINAPSTAEILALRTFGRSIDVRWVEWAVSMLVAGRDTPSLRVLAGESSPFNQFAMTALVDRTFEELNIRPFASPSDAAMAYASVQAHSLLDEAKSVEAVLGDIAQVCIELDYVENIYDFYLLRFAREDLQVSEEQYYWPDANRENIEEVIRDYCRTWLTAHPPIV